MIGKLHKIMKKIINNIYMKPDFHIIKKIAKNCNVNVT